MCPFNYLLASCLSLFPATPLLKNRKFPEATHFRCYTNPRSPSILFSSPNGKIDLDIQHWQSGTGREFVWQKTAEGRWKVKSAGLYKR